MYAFEKKSLPCLSAGAIADMSPLIKRIPIIPKQPTTGTV